MCLEAEAEQTFIYISFAEQPYWLESRYGISVRKTEAGDNIF